MDQFSNRMLSLSTVRFYSDSVELLLQLEEVRLLDRIVPGDCIGDSVLYCRRVVIEPLSDLLVI
jgi:hypothetical protein